MCWTLYIQLVHAQFIFSIIFCNDDDDDDDGGSGTTVENFEFGMQMDYIIHKYIYKKKYFLNDVYKVVWTSVSVTKHLQKEMKTKFLFNNIWWDLLFYYFALPLEFVCCQFSNKLNDTSKKRGFS